jgi:predicted nucleotidyltransferase
MRPVRSLETLTREGILAAIGGQAAELRGMGVTSLALFGSMARGEGAQTSDVDLLVELQPKTFDTYMDVKLFLERLLGRSVDLVLADTVKPRLRPTIIEEAIHAAGL